MKISKNNQTVIDRLRKENLTYLIIPFLKMVELDKLGKIKIHKMTWKVIMREVYDEDNARSDIENIILSYLVNFGIAVVKKKREDKRVSKDRVSKHRKEKKDLGYKSVSFLLPPDYYERLKSYKKEHGLSYSEAIQKLLNRA